MVDGTEATDGAGSGQIDKRDREKSCRSFLPGRAGRTRRESPPLPRTRRRESRPARPTWAPGSRERTAPGFRATYPRRAEPAPGKDGASDRLLDVRDRSRRGASGPRKIYVLRAENPIRGRFRPKKSGIELDMMARRYIIAPGFPRIFESTAKCHRIPREYDGRRDRGTGDGERRRWNCTRRDSR